MIKADRQALIKWRQLERVRERNRIAGEMHAAGANTVEIAERLGVSRTTAQAAIAAAKGKL